MTAAQQQEDGEEELILKAAGAELLPDGRRGLRIKGWIIESRNAPILGSLALQQLEENLGTSHLPEMVFGDSTLSLLHEGSGMKIHFNTFDALRGWKEESLPPVEVPAAAQWKFRSDPYQQVILDYDYTFTTPYSGSEIVESHSQAGMPESGGRQLRWVDCDQRIDLDALALRDTILYYDEVVLYEDELADNGVSLLTVKIRVMPSCWFLLLRFWLRVDGVLMRLRDTRMYCSFGNEQNGAPTILRETCWREATFQDLATKGFPSGSAAYNDPTLISQRLPIVSQNIQRLEFEHTTT